MAHPVTFRQITSSTWTYIVLPWDKRIGAIRRNDRPLVRYLYNPENDQSVRDEAPLFRLTGIGPNGNDFSFTITTDEWMKLCSVFGAEPTLMEASPDCAWGGFEWEDEADA